MDADISLCQLMLPEVMAYPYNLYRELREADPVHWDQGCGICRPLCSLREGRRRI